MRRQMNHFSSRTQTQSYFISTWAQTGGCWYFARNFATDLHHSGLTRAVCCEQPGCLDWTGIAWDGDRVSRYERSRAAARPAWQLLRTFRAFQQAPTLRFGHRQIVRRRPGTSRQTEYFDRNIKHPDYHWRRGGCEMIIWGEIYSGRQYLINWSPLPSARLITHGRSGET